MLGSLILFLVGLSLIGLYQNHKFPGADPTASQLAKRAGQSYPVLWFKLLVKICLFMYVASKVGQMVPITNPVFGFTFTGIFIYFWVQIIKGMQQDYDQPKHLLK